MKNSDYEMVNGHPFINGYDFVLRGGLAGCKLDLELVIAERVMPEVTEENAGRVEHCINCARRREELGWAKVAELNRKSNLPVEEICPAYNGRAFSIGADFPFLHDICPTVGTWRCTSTAAEVKRYWKKTEGAEK